MSLTVFLSSHNDICTQDVHGTCHEHNVRSKHVILGLNLKNKSEKQRFTLLRLQEQNGILRCFSFWHPTKEVFIWNLTTSANNVRDSNKLGIQDSYIVRTHKPNWLQNGTTAFSSCYNVRDSNKLGTTTFLYSTHTEPNRLQNSTTSFNPCYNIRDSNKLGIRDSYIVRTHKLNWLQNGTTAIIDPG